MPKEWTDEEIQEEINKAVKIVAEDRDRATYQRLHEKYGGNSGNDAGANPSGNPGSNPPPRKDGDPPTDPPKGKRSLWWGDRLEGD